MAIPHAWPPLSDQVCWNCTEDQEVLPLPHTTLAPAWQLLLGGDGSPTRLLALLARAPMAVDVIEEVSDGVCDCRADGGGAETGAGAHGRGAEGSGTSDGARSSSTCDDGCGGVDARAGLRCLHSIGDCAPPEVLALLPPLVRRRVVMREGGGGPPLMYAVSWWNAEDYRARMPDPGLPIGRSLGAQRVEQHRTLHAVVRGKGGVELAVALGAGGAADETLPHGGGLAAPGCACGAGCGAGGELWARHYTVRHGGKPLSVICEVFSPRLCRVLGPQAVGHNAPPYVRPSPGPPAAAVLGGADHLPCP